MGFKELIISILLGALILIAVIEVHFDLKAVVSDPRSLRVDVLSDYVNTSKVYPSSSSTNLLHVHDHPINDDHNLRGLKCPYIYVDMGTNIGHQIRKLYEPQIYRHKPVDDIVYKKYFPTSVDRKTICAFGFEANPIHTKRLKELEESYRILNVPVWIYTDVVCGDREGNKTFYRDIAAANRHEIGAGITTETLRDKVHLHPLQVREIDMSTWFYKILRDHTLGLNPVIIMKSDIEKADEMVLGHLLKTGILCNITAFYSEHIRSNWWTAAERRLRAAGCKTEYIYLDDEIGDDSLPLPHLIVHQQIIQQASPPPVILPQQGQLQEDVNEEIPNVFPKLNDAPQPAPLPAKPASLHPQPQNYHQKRQIITFSYVLRFILYQSLHFIGAIAYVCHNTLHLTRGIKNTFGPIQTKFFKR